MKFFWGLLLGLGLGVIIGLLVAPQPGEATLSQIRVQGEQLRSGALNDQIRARANDALTQGRELYTRTKDDLSDRYSRARAGDLQ